MTSPPDRRAADRPARDAGETLVELIMTVGIMGVAFVTILTAVLVSVKASGTDQRRVQAQNLLKTWAETLSPLAYIDCATPSAGAQPYGSATTLLGAALPTGWTGTYSDVRYWDGSAYQPTCSTDKGIQAAKLTLTVPAGQWPGFTLDLWVTKRKPCSAAGSC